MALPELQLPAGFPDFKADSFEYTPGKGFASVDRSGGTPRRRVLHLNPPATVKAELELDQAQIEEFFAWHEGPLNAGERPFTARVPKFGPGVAYQEAQCLRFQVDHREGVNNHLLSMVLRLKGEPQDELPVASTMAAEVYVGLVGTFSGGLPSALTAEVFLPLTGYYIQAADLFAEVTLILATEFSGAVPDPSMTAEVAVGLSMQTAVIPGEALAAEVAVALVQTTLIDVPLAAEITCGLVFNTTAVAGFIADPTNLDIFNNEVVSPGYYIVSYVMAASDGGIYFRTQSTGLTLAGWWWDPIQPGVGAGKWVRAQQISSTGSGQIQPQGAVMGPWLDLGTSREWGYQLGPVVATGSRTLQIDVATDPDGANIVSSWEVLMTFVMEA